MCGAKLIRKYIDAEVYKADVVRGAAPTPETVFNWGGTCDRVVAYSDKTTFIRPHEMYNSDGTYSNLYLNLLNFLEVEVSKAIANGEDGRTIGKLKRRLYSLKSNMVELFVGGITQADRDALRDLVEDAVLNIRSAAINGVGLGANMSGALAANKIQSIGGKLEEHILEAIKFAYKQITGSLYGIEMDNIDIHMENALINAENGVVLNIRTNVWDNNVKTSIMSDIVILDTVCRIIGIMATCNQFILPTAMHNIYENIE